MKGRRRGDAPFRVPICSRVIAIVKELEAAKMNEFVFPGLKRNTPLSNMAMLMLMREMHPGLTVHGLRSSFRDWAAEQTKAAHEVCEYALSHMPKSKVVKAYLRAALLDTRRTLMEAGAKYCDEPQPPARETARRRTKLKPANAAHVFPSR